MRRDMDVVRDLLKLSATTSAPHVDAYSLASPSRSRELIAYHVRIMTQAGLVDSYVVFPAYTGMIPGTITSSAATNGVPRIRGDDPVTRAFATLHWVCSPHTRG